MIIKNIERVGRQRVQYFGRVDGEVVTVIFIDGCVPTEGKIEVTDGTMVNKKIYSFYYVRNYKQL